MYSYLSKHTYLSKHIWTDRGTNSGRNKDGSLASYEYEPYFIKLAFNTIKEKGFTVISYIIKNAKNKIIPLHIKGKWSTYKVFLFEAMMAAAAM